MSPFLTLGYLTTLEFLEVMGSRRSNWLKVARFITWTLFVLTSRKTDNQGKI